MKSSRSLSFPQGPLAPELERILAGSDDAPVTHEASAISQETVWVTMRDGIRLATDIYRPPTSPAPVIATRTPYGRRAHAKSLLLLAQHGYVAIAQDCRGTGDSEPDRWDYYVFEREDSFDFVAWVTRQDWSGGFLGSYGASYGASTQWCMAMHPAMSTIVPQVGGLGVVPVTRPRFYMFMNAYSRSVGRCAEMAAVGYDEVERQMTEETLAGGYFNQPLYGPFSDDLIERYSDAAALPPAERQRWLWKLYSALPPAERAEFVKIALGHENVTTASVEALDGIFGHEIHHDAHALPRASTSDLLGSLHAPALCITSWYDWCLDDALATWDLLSREAPEPVRSRSRLLITPSAHNRPGYHEGREQHPELERTFRITESVDLWSRWYRACQADSLDAWPRVIYYLMGANEWLSASAWPPPDTHPSTFYLGPDGALTQDAPQEPSDPDRYVYDPEDPPPTLGGSIVSNVYMPGSVDVSAIQRRTDVLTYTTAVLEQALDVVGPLHLVLYASSTAVDTDFSARLSDVFPDGRAIQLQSATLRARYRNRDGDAELLEPERIYRFEMDMYATANRFKAGHRVRLDLSSADFPKYDRNTNRGGEPGPPIPAEQSVYRSPDHPSHLVVSVLGSSESDGRRT